MTTSDAKASSFSSSEEDFPLYFSEWLKHRHQELDLTQEQLAQRTSCSVFAIRKMESGERRPSKQLAKTLAQSLKLPCEDQAVFIKAAQGELSIDVLCALVENNIAQGDFSSAHLYLRAASNLFRASENKWLQVLMLYFRGLLAYYQADVGEAVVLLRKTTALARECRYKLDLARALTALGRVTCTFSECGQASELILEGLDLFRTLGHKLGIATALEEPAVVRAVQDEGGQAAMMFSVAHTLSEKPVISTRKTVQAIDRPLSLEANSHLSDSPAEIIASTVDGPDSIKQVITDHIIENISFRSDLERAEYTPRYQKRKESSQNHHVARFWHRRNVVRTNHPGCIKLRISSN